MPKYRIPTGAIVDIEAGAAEENIKNAPGYSRVNVDPLLTSSGRYADSPSDLLPTRESSPSRYGLQNINAPTPVSSEQDIRDRLRKEAQAQIDSLNMYYDKLVSGEREAGVKRDARTQALNLGAGTAGTVFASTRAAETEGITKKNLDLVNQQRSAEIGAILAGVDNKASERLELERMRYATEEQNYYNRLKDFRESARQDILNLRDIGVTSSQLRQDKERYNEILGASGLSDFELDKMLDKGNPNKFERYFQGNNLIELELDPTTNQILSRKTYNAEDLGLPKDIQPEFITNDLTGETMYYDKANPQYNEDGTLKLQRLGKYGLSVYEQAQLNAQAQAPTTIVDPITGATTLSATSKENQEFLSRPEVQDFQTAEQNYQTVYSIFGKPLSEVTEEDIKNLSKTAKATIGSSGSLVIRPEIKKTGEVQDLLKSDSSAVRWVKEVFGRDPYDNKDVYNFIKDIESSYRARKGTVEKIKSQYGPIPEVSTSSPTSQNIYKDPQTAPVGGVIQLNDGRYVRKISADQFEEITQ